MQYSEKDLDYTNNGFQILRAILYFSRFPSSSLGRKQGRIDIE